MDQRSMGNLKFDRRLERRRGWIDEKEVASLLDSLPDVVDKIAPPEETESGTAPEEGNAG